MVKTVKIKAEDFKSMLKEIAKEILMSEDFKSMFSEQLHSNDKVKVFFDKSDISFLEGLLERLLPDNDAESVVIKKIQTALSDAQVNL